MNRKLIDEVFNSEKKYVFLTKKGFNFLEKYKAIIDFIEEFEL